MYSGTDDAEQNQNPEMAKALVVAARFVSDLSLLEVKSMLRGRGEKTREWLPRPLVSSPTTLMEVVYQWGCWASYLIRANVRIAEYLCDVCSWRVISAQEEEFFRGRLTRRFASDMYALKSSNQEAQSDLLQRLIKQYENIETGENLKGAVIHCANFSCAAIYHRFNLALSFGRHFSCISFIPSVSSYPFIG